MQGVLTGLAHFMSAVSQSLFTCYLGQPPLHRIYAKVALDLQ